MQRLKESVRKAERSANKKISQQVVTKLSSVARAKYNIKASDLKDGVKVKYSEGDQVASRVIFSMQKIPLLRFSARITRKGVSVMVIKGSRKVVVSAFVPSLRNGHENIFVRTRYGNVRVGRLPIMQLYGPSPAQLMFNTSAREIALGLIQNKWNKIFQHELEFYNKK